MKKKASPRSSSSERGKKPASKSVKKTSPGNDRIVSVIVFAFAFLLYANTLNHGYVLDDDVVFLKNKDVQAGTAGIKSILSHSFIYGFTGHNDQSYRPVVLILFAIEKQWFGNNPHTGHFINVLLFALSCLLFYNLLKRFFRDIPSPGNIWIPVAAAFLFAAHPIHTEAVANIKGRDDILNFIFLMISLISIFKYTDLNRKKYLLVSVLCFFLSLLCKEMAVTFLVIIPMTVLFFSNIPFKKIVTGTIPFIAVFILYMLIRSSVLDTVTFEEKMKVVNNALAAATTESDRIATAIYILGKYLALLFYPHPLSWDYSFNQIPIVSFSDIRVILTVLILSGIGFFSAWITFKKIKDPGSHEVSLAHVLVYCALFFLATMSVVSNLFIMIGSTLGERFLFVPSMAFCIAIAFFINRFGKNILFGATGAIIILFSLKTFTRNKDWADNLSLFKAGVEATPNSSRAQSALGSSYREAGEKEPDPAKRAALFRQALVYYKKAIDILPDNTEALYNAGVAYYGSGNSDEALKVYQKALEVTPEYTNAANNAGVIYFERKDYENAKKYFLQAIKYDPNNSDALGNLGAINHNQGNMKEAIEYYKRALAINPGNQNVQNNLAKAEGSQQGQK